MTAPSPERDEDGAWLDALAGRPVSDEFALVKRQADSLRRALQRRSERLDAEMPDVDDALFLRIQEAISDGRAPVPGGHPMSLPTERRGRARPWLWGLAASIMLGTVLTASLLMTRGDGEHEVLRGPKDTILIDSDPSARLAQLRVLLEGAGATPDVRVDKAGTIVITVAGTPQVLDALGSERIYPQPTDGKIILIIEKPAAQKP